MAAGVAVIADGNGAIAMRTPVRPDEVERHQCGFSIRVASPSSWRATLRPFYGIEPTSWVRDGDSGGGREVVIVEGAEALREPEAGFSEDLSRAWFILTAQPVVSHVLLVPRALPLVLLQETLTFLDAREPREWHGDRSGGRSSPTGRS